MSIKVGDRIRQNTLSTGVGGVSLVGDVPGFKRFSDVLSSGDITYYVIEENDKFEVGVGIYGSDNLERFHVLSSSNNGNKIELGGSGAVFVTYPADKSVIRDLESQVIVGASGLVFENGTTFKEAKIVELTDVNLAGTPSNQYLIDFNTTNKSLVIGESAGPSNSRNTLIGHGAGSGITSGISNTNIGTDAGHKNEQGFKNVSIGDLSGPSDENASISVSRTVNVGYQAGEKSRDDSVNIGFQAGAAAYSRGHVSIGSFSGSGVGNYAFIGGYEAATDHDGDYLVAIGYRAAKDGGGESSVWIGKQAGQDTSSAINSIGLGELSGQGSSGNNSIYLGKKSGKDNADNDMLFVSNNDPSAEGTLIKGNFSTKRLAVGKSDVTLSDTFYVGVNSSTDNGIVVQGASLQSSDLTQWRAFDGLSLASVSNSGTILSNGIAASGQGVRLDSSTPVITDSTLYNVAGSLYWSGSSLTDQISYASGQAIVNEADIAYVSGIIENNTSGDTYVSGIAVYSSGQAIANQVDISYVSGVAVYASGNVYDDSYISGVAVYSSGQAIQNEIDIAYISGVVENNDSGDTYVSGIAVYSSGQAIANQGDISYVSGIAIYASGNVYDDTYISGVATYSSGILVDGGTLIPDAGKGVAITKGSENFPITITQDENSSGGVHYIRLTDTDTDNITLGGTDVDAFQITASGEGSSDLENLIKFSSFANDDHLVFGGITVPTKVLGSNITVNAEGSVELQRGGSTRVRGDSAFTYLFGQTGGYIFYGANALKPQSATSIALGGASNYWGSLYSSNANLKGSAAINVPLTIDAQAAQSANLTEWKASDGVVIAQVSPDGSIASSGDISSSGTITGDSYKIYNVGGDGDTVTEYLELVTEANNYKIQAEQTGGGTIRPIFLDGHSVRFNTSGNARMAVLSNGVYNYVDSVPNADGSVYSGQPNRRWAGVFSHYGEFSNTVSSSGVQASGLLLYDHVPTVTTNTLYNDGGTLMFNGSAVDSGQVSGAASGVAFFGNDGLLTDDTSFVFNSGNKELELSAINAHKTQSCDLDNTGNSFQVDLTSDNTWLNNQYANNFTSKILGDGASNQISNITSALEFRDSAHTGTFYWGTNSKVSFLAPVSMGSSNRVMGLEGGFNNSHFCSFLGTHLVGVRAYNSFNYNPTVNSSTKFVGFKSETSATPVSGVADYLHFWATDTNCVEIGNSYGMYIEEQTKGTTGNYSIYTAGGLSEFNGRVSVVGDNSTQVPFAVNSAVSQSANLTEWQASDGVVVAQVEPDGSIASSGDISASGDVTAAGLNSESLKVFNVGYDGATDSEYLAVETLSNQFFIYPKKTGSGGNRDFYLRTLLGSAGAGIKLAANGTGYLQFGSSTNLNWGNGYIRPYVKVEPATDGNIPLGSSLLRWSNVASVSGDFSDTVRFGSWEDSGLTGYVETVVPTADNEPFWIDRNWSGGSSSGRVGLRTDYNAAGTAHNYISVTPTIAEIQLGNALKAQWQIAGNVHRLNQHFRPYVDSTYDNGSTTARWLGTYSVDGDFSGSISGARGFFESSTTTDSPLTITSATSQTANLTEWKNSSDETLTRVTSDGSVHVSGDIVSEQGGEIRSYILGKPGDTDTEYLRIGDIGGAVHEIRAYKTGSGQNRHIRMISADYRGKVNLYSDGHFNYGFNNNLTFSAFHWGISVSGEIRNMQYGNPSSLGQPISPFAAGYLNSVYTSGVQTSGVLLNSHVPTVTTNTLYNDGGTLMFNGSAVGGGGSVTGTPSGIAFFADDGSLTDHTDLITSSGTNGRRIGINSVANPTYQLTVGNQVYLQSAVAEIKNYSHGNSMLQIVATSGGRSANIKYTSGSVDWYSGHLQASMSGLGSRFVVASYELDNTKPLVYDSNGDFIIGGMQPSARLTVNSRGTTIVNTVFKATASQTANMAEWRASDDVVIAKVTADGSIASSGTVSATNLSVFASGELGDTDSESLTLSSDGTTYDIFSTPTGAGSHRRIDIGGMTGVAYRGLRLDYDNGFLDWQYNNATKFKVDANTCNISTTTTVTNDIRSDNHRPLADNTYDSGETGFRWANGYFVNGDFNGTLNASGVGMMRIAEADYPSYQEGTFFYDDESHALAIYNDESETIQRLGQEEFLRVRNNTAETIDTGCAVLITGAHGASVPTVSGAIATSEANSQVVGLANHPIESNSFGYITTFGKVKGVDTSQYSEGDEIFLSSENIGSGVSTSPTVPNYKLSIGHCIRSHANNGSMMVQLGHPKLGGGDTKSVAPVHVSGIPFVSGVANEGASAVLMYEDGFEYSQGSGLITNAITASSGTFLSGVSVNSSSPVRSSPLDVYGDPAAVNKVVAQFKSSTGASVLNVYNGNSDTTPVASLRSTNAYLSIYNGVDIRKTGGSGKMFGVQNPGNETKFKVDTDGEVALGSTANLYSYTNLGTLDVIPKSTSFPGIAVIANASQTANLQEWKASDEVNVATVAPDGSIASSGNISASGNLVANEYLKFYGGNGPDIYATSTYGYLRNNAGASRLRWGGSDLFVFSSIFPNTPNAYDLGDHRTFRNLYLGTSLHSSGVQTSGVLLNSHVPTVTTNTLYNNGGTLTWDGHFAASSKSFLIDHPTKKDAKLQYASLEGPEHGVYVRGRVTENVIELPDHWTGLVDEESITVQLTAKGHPQPNMFVSSIVNNKVYISSDVDIDAFYNVYAERKDIDKLEVEIWQ